MADFSLNEYLCNYFNFSYMHDGIDAKELSMLFTIFVFMQFWNIFNAKAYRTHDSALKDLFSKEVRGFRITLFVIFLGQILIVSFGGELFNVIPLALGDWMRIILGSSVILWIGEMERMLKRMA